MKILNINIEVLKFSGVTIQHQEPIIVEIHEPSSSMVLKDIPAEAIVTPKRKRIFTATPSADKSKTYLKQLTDRIVERKNNKDQQDTHLLDKKLSILKTEESIKKMELEIKTMEFNHLKLKQELEIQHIRKRHELELRNLQIDAEIKEIQLKKLI